MEFVEAAGSGDPSALSLSDIDKLFQETYCSVKLSWQKLLQLADGGDCPVAAAYVAMQYSEGEFLNDDLAERYAKLCLPWIQESLATSMRAQFFLGFFHSQYYCDKISLDYNLKESARLLRMAAEQGFALAQYYLSHALRHGVDIDKDENEAFRMARLAAEQGHPGSLTLLGSLYQKGCGVVEDRAEAFRWFERAAELGDVLAEIELAKCFDHGIGVNENKAESLMWYRSAAGRGNIEACRCLAHCYATGNGVAQNFVQVAKWLQAASNLRFEMKIAHEERLGFTDRGDFLYDIGEFMMAQAVDSYRLSAEVGSKQGQYKLGLLLEERLAFPVDQNPEEYVKWYRLAADQGSQLALRRLSRL